MLGCCQRCSSGKFATTTSPYAHGACVLAPSEFTRWRHVSSLVEPCMGMLLSLTFLRSSIVHILWWTCPHQQLVRSWPPGGTTYEEHDLDFFGAEAKRRLGSDLRDLPPSSPPQAEVCLPQQAAGPPSPCCTWAMQPFMCRLWPFDCELQAASTPHVQYRPRPACPVKPVASGSQ